MNRPNNNSLGLLGVFSFAMFVLGLVYHMLIGGRGFLSAVFFALIFAAIVAALIYLFLMTTLGMEWSQAARKKIESKAGEVKGKIDDARASNDAESASSPASEHADSEASTDAAAAVEQTEAVAADPAPVEPTRVEPPGNDTAPARPKSVETRPVESSQAEPATEEHPRVEPTRVQTRLTEPAAASEATDMSEDYDRDDVVEGAGEGTKPSGLDAPRGGQADDLKKIKGVGPKLEKQINEMGIWHFDQVAAWSADEVAWVDANLPGLPGRVSRDKWVEQAKTLAAGGATEFSKRVEGGDVY